MFGSSRESNSIASAPITQALELLKKKKGTVLVDVRNPDEYKSERIAGSVNIPLGTIVNAQNLIPDKSTPLLVYCLSGARSHTAAIQLSRMGYTDITDLGGIAFWPYETISG